jgi:hypothetical protein
MTRSLIVGLVTLLAASCSGTKSAPSRSEAYENPADGKTYVAPSGWKTYHPEQPTPDAPGTKVKTDQVRLLTAETDIAARTTGDDLATFVKEVQRLSEEKLGKLGRELKVLVQFDCTPEGHTVKLAHQGEASQELLQGYQDALQAVKKLPVKEGSVAFQVEMTVRP